MNPKIQYIITYGDPHHGFEYIGPFDNADEADNYAKHTLPSGFNWWVWQLQHPSMHEEQEENNEN